MPVATTQKTVFGGKEFTMRVNVNKHGTFTIRLPVYSHRALGVELVESNTLPGAVKKFEEQRSLYGKTLRSRRRVIRYSFLLQDKSSRYGPENGERNDLHFGIGKGLQFAVANCTETTYKDPEGKELRRSYDGDKDQPYGAAYCFGNFDGIEDTRKGIKTIGWSEERQAWFLSFCAAFDALIDRVKLLDENQGQLIRLMERFPMMPAGVLSLTGCTIPRKEDDRDA